MSHAHEPPAPTVPNVPPAGPDVWKLAGRIMGVYRPASMFLEMPGLEMIDPALFMGKTIRELGPGYTTKEGKDVGGYCVLVDTFSMLFSSSNNARRWVNNKTHVNVNAAPSLTHLQFDNVSLFLVIISTNLLRFYG